MLLIKRAAFSSQGGVFQFFLKHNKSHVICPISYKVTSEKTERINLHKNKGIVQLRRPLHVTNVNRDLEAGLRALGAGVAATGVFGSGIGLGVLFGNVASAVGRNPSAGKQIMGNAILGAAFCESLGLFALVMSFILLP